MRSRIHFFAVKEDWDFVFDYVERKRNLVYTATGDEQMRNPDPPRYLEGKAIPNLGTASAEQCIGCDSFMISSFPQVPTPIRSIMFDGEPRYDLRSSAYPDTIRLIHAGRWKEMIVSGLIDTMSQGPKAQSLINAFHAAMKKHFTRVNAYWVGPQAHKEWQQGRRLSAAEQSPPEYDLQLG